ncbi:MULTISPECIES: DUF485 domain-containing protein [unclassified Corynebacterium]|uniref:DUF485 domain-containing protein n=1 Tax=unclassified Corynebacterium TaxID=2624378 RepID=UPI001C4523D1|nr:MULTISPECIES: DUF485 domain-containing protein [unclassified Corynebacterium]MBV7281369.1 DUF485 domain-containing protein [Corynebacterium sp. TAE3-ERU30]MBV7301937.1 DUF485 domain-containing protein [Corynebacterium sp. TAE3-ERU2]
MTNTAPPPEAQQPRRKHEPTAQEFREMQKNPEFQELRSTFRSFAFPMSVAFLVWYVAFVLLATYAPDLLAVKVYGAVNLGIVLGALQFFTTFLITWIYVRYANKNIEPKAAHIRQLMEG